MSALVASYYATARTEVDATVDDGMSEIERLEAEAAELYRRAHDLGEQIDTLVELGKTPTLPLTQLYLGCVEEHRQRAKLLADLRGSAPQDEVDALLARLWQVLPPAEQPETATATATAAAPLPEPDAAGGALT